MSTAGWIVISSPANRPGTSVPRSCGTWAVSFAAPTPPASKASPSVCIAEIQGPPRVTPIARMGAADRQLVELTAADPGEVWLRIKLPTSAAPAVRSDWCWYRLRCPIPPHLKNRPIIAWHLPEISMHGGAPLLRFAITEDTPEPATAAATAALGIDWSRGGAFWILNPAVTHLHTVPTPTPRPTAPTTNPLPVNGPVAIPAVKTDHVPKPAPKARRAAPRKPRSASHKPRATHRQLLDQAVAVCQSNNATKARRAGNSAADKIRALGDLTRYQVPAHLRAAAELRLAHPEKPMVELAAIAGITKDTYSSQLRRFWENVNNKPAQNKTRRATVHRRTKPGTKEPCRQ